MAPYGAASDSCRSEGKGGTVKGPTLRPVNSKSLSLDTNGGDSRSPAQETTDRVAMTSTAHIPRLRTGTSTPPFRFQQNTYRSVSKLPDVSDTSHSWDSSPATDVIG